MDDHFVFIGPLESFVLVFTITLSIKAPCATQVAAVYMTLDFHSNSVTECVASIAKIVLAGPSGRVP